MSLDASVREPPMPTPGEPPVAAPPATTPSSAGPPARRPTIVCVAAGAVSIELDSCGGRATCNEHRDDGGPSHELHTDWRVEDPENDAYRLRYPTCARPSCDM